MPVILSDDTWARIEKMLEDYEAGVLRVIPGNGLKLDEQISAKANCPGTKLSVDPTDATGFPAIALDVCVDGSPVNHTFLISK